MNYLKLNYNRFVFFLLIFLMIVSGSIISQYSLAAEIKGKVIGPSGEYLDGAEISIYNNTNLIHRAIVLNGSYDINLSEGEYFVVAKYVDKMKNLYIDLINLSLKKDEVQQLDFYLTSPYTNFSDIDIPELEDIFKVDTFSTNTSQNITKESNVYNKNVSNTPSENILALFLIIFIPVIVFVFFYILKVYYKAERIEDEVESVQDKVKDVIGTKREEKENKENVPIISTEEAKEEGKIEEKATDEKERSVESILQKEKESLLSSLTENERLIVKVLMEHNGTLLRTEIARSTNLPKSSLTMALRRLEEKKIIEIDKTFTIHKVKFTSWFKSLL